jgi:hypothetical protein
MSLLNNYQVSTRRLQVSVLFETCVGNKPTLMNNDQQQQKGRCDNSCIGIVKWHLCFVQVRKLLTMQQPHVPKEGTLHDTTTSVQMEGKATEKQNNAKQGQGRSEQ